MARLAVTDVAVWGLIMLRPPSEWRDLGRWLRERKSIYSPQQSRSAPVLQRHNERRLVVVLREWRGDGEDAIIVPVTAISDEILYCPDLDRAIALFARLG